MCTYTLTDEAPYSTSPESSGKICLDGCECSVTDRCALVAASVSCPLSIGVSLFVKAKRSVQAIRFDEEEDVM